MAALGVWWFVGLLFKDRTLSLLTALFFVVHPTHSEAVAYVSGRADPLAATFIFLTLIYYVKQLEAPRASHMGLMLAAFICALLSKEYSLIVPVLVLVYHFCMMRPLKVNAYAALVATAVLYLVFRFAVVETQGGDTYPEPTFGQRLPGIFVAFAHYLRLLPAPFPLHMEYGGLIFDWAYPVAWVGVVLFGLVVWAAYRARATRGIVLFSILWFLIALAPNSNLITLNAYMAEHWLYVPSLGFCLLLSYGLIKLSGHTAFKKVAIGAGAGILALFFVLTVRQTYIWADPARLYEHTLQYAPQSSRLNSNLGIIYHKRGRKEEALELFKRALELDPDNLKAYGNLGNAYRAADRLEDAARLHKKIIQLKPRDSGAYNNLGTVYFDMKKLDEAEAMFRKALRLHPNHATAANNLGLVLNAKGKHQEAEKYLLKAIELRPNYAEAYFTLAIIYINRRDFQKSITYCDKAQELGYERPALLKALAPHR